MKTYRTIAGVIPVLLVLLCALVFPDAHLAQNSTTVSKATIRQSKLRTDKRKAEAKKVVEEFFDGFFVDRIAAKTVERLVFLEACDEIDEKYLNCIDTDEVPRNWGHRLNARIAAILFRYEVFGDYFVILGTEPILDDSSSYPYSSSEYAEIRRNVLKEKAYASVFDVERPSRRQIERKLDEMEKNWKELENVIFNRIDKSLYKKNIDILKESMEVRTGVKNGRTYYGVNMEAFVYTFILAVRGGRMKIITLEDGI